MTQAQDCWAANLTASASALDFGRHKRLPEIALKY